MCGRQSIEHLQSVLAQMMQDIKSSTEEIALNITKVLTIYSKYQEDVHSLLLQQTVKQQMHVYIQNILTQCKYADGAGFASHIEEKDYWILEWWFKHNTNHQQHYLEVDQGTQQRLDFTTFEWFEQTAKTKQTYIHGPYVDYVCTSNTAYTITTAHPIFFQNQFLGVAVVDLLVSTLERFILPALTRITFRIAITNADGRILISNDAKLRTGSILKAPIKLIFEDKAHPFKILVL